MQLTRLGEISDNYRNSRQLYQSQDGYFLFFKFRYNTYKTYLNVKDPVLLRGLKSLSEIGGVTFPHLLAMGDGRLFRPQISLNNILCICYLIIHYF